MVYKDIDEIFPMERFHSLSRKNGIKLGISANLAGHTRELLLGVYIALKEVDDAGIPIEILWRNDERKEESAKKAANDFVSQKVHGVIGHLSASASVPASTIYNNKTIFFAPGTSHPNLIQPSFKTVFRLCGRDDDQAKKIISFIKLNFSSCEKFVLLKQNIEYGHILSSLIQEEWHKNLANNLKCFLIPSTDKNNFYKQINTLKANFIIFAGIHELASEVITSLRKEGFKGKFLLSDDSFIPDFMELAGQLSEGAYVISIKSLANDHVSKLVNEFSTLTDLKEVGAYFFTSYAATKIVIEAISTIGYKNYSIENISNFIRSRKWLTPLGEIGFTSDGEVKGIEWDILQIRKGLFSTINMAHK